MFSSHVNNSDHNLTAGVERQHCLKVVLALSRCSESLHTSLCSFLELTF